MNLVINDFIEFLGLNYEPLTFADAFGWLVLVMVACSMLSGIIRTMFSFAFMGRSRH